MSFLILFSFDIVAPQLRISFGTSIQIDSIREGNDVYLECRVKANPAIKEVVWLHNDRPIHSLMAGETASNNNDGSKGQLGSTVIMTNQSLVIQKVHRSHRGRYQCLAFNEQGKTISDPLYLKVNCKYKMLGVIKQAANDKMDLLFKFAFLSSRTQL